MAINSNEFQKQQRNTSIEYHWKIEISYSVRRFAWYLENIH